MEDKNTSKQIKSKERVKDHGEVFTNPREVNAMLDLVKDESYRVGSRFLEPACGNGNFLVEILARKLQTVYKEIDEQENKVDQENIEKQTFIAVSSIYGIDIQKDNCEESIERMYDIILDKYRGAFPESIDEEFLKSIRYVLNKNIIHGDGLTGLQEITGEPILFSEWTFEDGEFRVKRKDFSMNDMIEHENSIAENERLRKGEEMVNKNAKTNLFSQGVIKAEVKPLKPSKEFSKIYFKQVSTQG